MTTTVILLFITGFLIIPILGSCICAYLTKKEKFLSIIITLFLTIIVGATVSTIGSMYDYMENPTLTSSCSHCNGTGRIIYE